MSNSTIVRISSDQFTSKIGETLTIDIPSSLISRPVKSIRLLDAIIPFTFSNVPSNQTDFGFTDPAGTNTITLPNHTFTPGNIIEILQEQLTENSGAGLEFVVRYHSCEGTFTIQGEGGAFSLDFTVPNSAAPLLGFDPVVYNAVETPPASNIYIIESASRNQLNIDKYMNITSNLITGIDQGIIILNGKPNPTINNVIASIPISGTSGGNIFFTESDAAPDIDIQASVLGKVVPPNTDATRSVEFGLDSLRLLDTSNFEI